MSESTRSDHTTGLEIAVIGMAGRFPGAPSVDAFWQNLRDGVESITFFSDHELASAGVGAATLQDTAYVKAGAVLEDIELFDAAFFGYNPREAEILDPQQRLFLECAWESLEHAGYDTESYTGRIGVYASASINTYLLSNLYPNLDLTGSIEDYQIMLENGNDFLTTRVSYKLNLQGPSVVVQTACSSSLVAVHLACRSLLSNESDMALAGGVSIRAPQQAGYLYHEGGIMSPDGHCRAFDARSQGIVNGNGVGIVVLKRLEDALADGDTVLAIIEGSAINNDGALKVGYTAPAIDGQAKVISAALAMAEIDPETISYIEAHGTGTPLGDPIEIAALNQVFRPNAKQTNFCAIGSVKTNIGHLDAAAGVAGLIKTVLALKHQMLPPSLHFETPNPAIDFEHSRFRVNAALTPWEAGAFPRRAGVSSFGIGGTNAHVALKEAPRVEASGDDSPWYLLPISAKTESALEKATANLAAYLRQHPESCMVDVAYTLQRGRRPFNHRRVLVCRDHADALATLESRDPTRLPSTVQESRKRPVVFMFPGQGAQYVTMAQEIYATEPVFREQIDRCAELLRPHLGLDIRTLLYPREPAMGDEEWKTEDRESSILDQTQYAQPALFVIEYALAQLWMSWGVYPQAMIGHSIGEYVAACLAGVFSLEDGLGLVAARGRLMQSMPPGVMLVVALPEQELLPRLGDEISVAAVNETARCVVSGPATAIAALERRLAGQGVACRRLHTSHAFHSAMMAPIVVPFTEQIQKITLRPPQIRYISNVTGTWITASEATDPGYWARHMRQTVHFAAGVGELLQEPARILLEVGPGQTLGTLARQHPGRAADQIVLASMRHPKDSISDVAFLLGALGKLWLAGRPIDWARLYRGKRHRRVSLPTYPFERQRYWVEPSERAPTHYTQPGSLAKKAEIAEWFYIPSWKRSVPLASAAPGALADQQRCWLVFVDSYGLGSAIVDHLQQDGQDVITVAKGESFARLNASAYRLNPRQRQAYDRLFATLEASNNRPTHIIHLWTVTEPEPIQSQTAFSDLLGGIASRQAASETACYDELQYSGFYSLLFIAQALGQQQRTDPIHIGVVSNNMQWVASEEAPCPEKALVLGPCKVIPQEYPHCTCRSIDVRLSAAKADQIREMAEQLIADFASPSTDAVVAYRGHDRWVQTFEPTRLEESDARVRSLIKQQGVYLITGGLGGVGLELAAYLARAAQAKLVLVGRSSFPKRDAWEAELERHDVDERVSRVIRRLKSFEEQGAEILVVSADVTDEEHMRAMIASARARFGPINGVIHAAGIAGGGTIQLKTAEEAARVLAPKVQGTRTLAAMLCETPLDFLVLCSSMISVTGGFGRADYCAANSFLDAFAHCYAAAHGTYTTAINWDTWQAIGMAANAAPRSLGHLQQATGTAIAHPLLDRCILQTPEQGSYAAELSVAKHWVLSEHHIMGSATVPGTAYLEMARAAFESHTGGATAVLADVFFLAPLMVGPGETKEARVILERASNEFDFRVVSRAAPGRTPAPVWQEHVRGRIGPSSTAALRHWDIASIVARCRMVERQIDEQELASKGIALGPRWNNLLHLYLGSNEALAVVALPQSFSADLAEYTMHPALLDEATSFASQFLAEGVYLPLSYKTIRINDALPGKVWSYARYKEDTASTETISIDLVIMDADGVELVVIEDFTLKRVTDDAAERLEHGAEEAARQGMNRRAAANSFEPTAPTAPRGYEALTDAAALLADEGVEVFRRIMVKRKLPQVIVSTRDLQALVEQIHALTPTRTQETAANLPAVAHTRPLLQTPYVAPRNDIEQHLAEIWQSLLGIGQIGIYDHFFELGGDSLLAIQVLARAKQAGLQLTTQQIFQQQTIADLAAVATTTPTHTAEQHVIVGQVPLTAIQQWFFAQDLPTPSHWNQALILKPARPLDPDLLRRALQHLLMHHDALRLRFERTETGWRQINAGWDAAAPFTRIDLAGIPASRQIALIEATTAELQASLDLSQGPIMRVALFDGGARAPSHLLIIIHHLAVDLGSWRILIEDLQTAYQQLRRSEAIVLQAKTTSFKRWAEHLAEYAQSEECMHELAYWLAANRAEAACLPLDYPPWQGANTEASACVVSESLSAEETRILLQEVPQAYRTQTNDVLLTALVQAIAEWTGRRALLVDLESDGRDELLFADLDLSRMVGWCTTLYPMPLDLEGVFAPGSALKSIKEQLRSVPHGGIGYGALRYLCQDTRFSGPLQALPQPEVNFLYLGKVDQGYAAPDSFGSIQPSSGPDHSPQGHRSHILEINASIVEERLWLDWTYSENLHRRSTIEHLAQEFMAALRALIAHCQSPEAGGYTPSDFLTTGLSQADLDDLIAEFDALEEEV
jgi:phthiocerol/phenolphthiocerol synthesis type-I polyketide synthase E